MKKITIFLVLFVSTSILTAQYDAFTFQALILDQNKNPRSEASVLVRATVSADSDQQLVYYQEEHQLTSSEQGTIQMVIGQGEVLQGAMTEIKWLDSIPYMSVEYDLLDGNGWQNTGTKKFSTVPFCLESKNIICHQGVEGPRGDYGPVGETGPPAPIVQPNFGPQGPPGPAGVPVIMHEPTPISPQVGRVYLDDGSNTSDGNPGFRYYDGSGWIDL